MTKEYDKEASKRMIELAKNGAHSLNPALFEQEGANPNYRDESGYSAMDYATTGMNTQGEHRNGGWNGMNSTNMRLLIRLGVDPYEVGGTGHSPVQNLIYEAKYANQWKGVSDVKHNLIAKGEDPFGDFIKKFDNHRNPQQNNHDAVHGNDYIRIVVEERNAYLQKQLAEARAASQGVSAEEKPAAAPKPRGKWQDGFSQATVDGYVDREVLVPNEGHSTIHPVSGIIR